MASSTRHVVNVRCSKIEKRVVENKKHEKQQVYSFIVNWSDGTTSEVEKTSSSLQDFRNRLKQEVYTERCDVSIPELPAAKRFELKSAAKKEEKNRRAIDEFCQQMLKLPEVKGKRDFVLEFFANCERAKSSHVASSNDQSLLKQREGIGSPVSSAPLDSSAELGVYAEISDNWAHDVAPEPRNKLIKADVVPPSHQSQAVDGSPAVAVYAQVNKQSAKKKSELRYADLELASANEQLSRRCTLPSSTLYAEIDSELVQGSPVKAETLHANRAVPRPRIVDNEQFVVVDQTATPTSTAPTPENSTDEIDGHIPVADEAIDESQDRIEDVVSSEGTQVYENSTIVDAEAQRRKNSQNRRFYRVLKGYVPNMAHSQGLTVKEGDIVQVQCESESRMLCTLVANKPDVIPIEGWLPSDILQVCSPEASKCRKSTISIAQENNVTKPVQAVSEQEANTFHPTLELHMQESGDSSSAIPTMPSGLPPCCDLLDSRQEEMSDVCRAHCQDTESIYVVAVADYTGSDDQVVSFTKGMFGALVYASSSHWWCVRFGNLYRWVPSSYWRIYHNAAGGVNVATNTAPWMVGMMERTICEDQLMRCGQERDFVVRESTNLAASFVISIRHQNRVRHFPIVLTTDGHHFIGKHYFTTIFNVIIYYKKNFLFHNEDESGVKLGNPFFFTKA